MPTSSRRAFLQQVAALAGVPFSSIQPAITTPGAVVEGAIASPAAFSLANRLTLALWRTALGSTTYGKLFEKEPISPEQLKQTVLLSTLSANEFDQLRKEYITQHGQAAYSGLVKKLACTLTQISQGAAPADTALTKDIMLTYRRTHELSNRHLRLNPGEVKAAFCPTKHFAELLKPKQISSIDTVAIRKYEDLPQVTETKRMLEEYLHKPAPAISRYELTNGREGGFGQDSFHYRETLREQHREFTGFNR